MLARKIATINMFTQAPHCTSHSRLCEVVMDRLALLWDIQMDRLYIRMCGSNSQTIRKPRLQVDTMPFVWTISFQGLRRNWWTFTSPLLGMTSGKSIQRSWRRWIWACQILREFFQVSDICNWKQILFFVQKGN